MKLLHFSQLKDFHSDWSVNSSTLQSHQMTDPTTESLHKQVGTKE